MYNMSILSTFNTSNNINLLWEILLDELCINSNNKELTGNIKIVFDSNIKLFTAWVASENPKTNIMNLNKHFLSQVVLAVNRIFPHLNIEKNIKRITITSEESANPYKIEDIQASRKNDFEKELEKKRMELDEYMVPQKPQEMDFTYKEIDGKITTMSSLVEEKILQRNTEFENFNNIETATETDKWLLSKDTSVHSEKYNAVQITNDKQKSVSWDVKDTDTPINIFQKHKQHTADNVINQERTQYIEQKSVSLPLWSAALKLLTTSSIPPPSISTSLWRNLSLGCIALVWSTAECTLHQCEITLAVQSAMGPQRPNAAQQK